MFEQSLVRREIAWSYDVISFGVNLAEALVGQSSVKKCLVPGV